MTQCEVNNGAGWMNTECMLAYMYIGWKYAKCKMSCRDGSCL